MNLMSVAQAYFDESATHDGSAAVCVAGYVFEKESAIALTAEWQSMLAQYALPFFRMSDCAHQTGNFKGMAKKEIDQVARKAIELTKKYAAAGIAVSIEMDVFHLIPRPKLFETPYGFACSQVLLGVQSWADKSSFKGEIEYFFEAGAVNQREANKLMKAVFDKPELKQRFRQGALTFAEKAAAPLLQCADLLAWHWHTFNRRQREGKKPMRADFKSLVGRRNVDVHHYDRESIERWLIEMHPKNSIAIDGGSS